MKAKSAVLLLLVVWIVAFLGLRGSGQEPSTAFRTYSNVELARWTPPPTRLVLGGHLERLVQGYPKVCHLERCVFMEELLTFIAREGR